jgi:lysophospholipid acyltransferase (LPLAT)-like uncharacterized protein
MNAMKHRASTKTLRYWLLLNLGVPIVSLSLWVLRKTWNTRWKKKENLSLRPAILAIWHRDLLAGATAIPSFLPAVDILASHSRDAQLIVRLASMWGAGAVRGGSSRGQFRALRSMRRSLEMGRMVIVTVDGPRGPAGVVKPGAVLLAAQTGAPIVPGAMLSDKAWRFRSWDRAMLPKPFATVSHVCADPIRVPPTTDRDTLASYCRELEECLNLLHEAEMDPPASRQPGNGTAGTNHGSPKTVAKS